MHDEEAVSTGPGSGNMSLLNGTAAHEMHAPSNPTQTQSGGRRTLQRILVVEDDATLAALESEILTAHGYNVVTVNSGELAISTLRGSIPDLVVLDIELTGKVNGWDVLRTLRASANTPVLLTTSSGEAVRTHIRSRGESRATLDHLPKPYPMQTLLKRVKRMLMIAPQ